MKNNLKNLIEKNLIDPADQTIINKIIQNPAVMTNLAKQAMRYFFYICFGRYIKYKVAPFHLEFFDLAQDNTLKRVGVVGFRNCAKSTILNLAYALWAIIGTQQKKHVVIASKTQERARGHLKNIRQEIEKNSILRKLVGPFYEEKAEPWNISTLHIPSYNASITAISVDEGIRGLREGPYRPDLIIVDDIEDSASAKTAEGRDKVFSWLTHELLNLGDANTKVVFIANFVHDDSALIRIERLINTGEMSGKFVRIPIIDDNDNIVWPGMFPTKKSLEEFRKSIGNNDAWLEEYLLKPAMKGSRVIQPKWIKNYDLMPAFDSPAYRYTIIGVDLAISEKTAADYTAMVIASVFGYDKDLRIYIHPNPINAKIDFPTTVETTKQLSQSLGQGIKAKLAIESNGYQDALVQQLRKDNFEAIGVKTRGDKHSRLSLVTPLIQNCVLFPSKGTEELIRQLTGFPAERHDDLVDALIITLSQIQENESKEPNFIKHMKWRETPEGKKECKEIAKRTQERLLQIEEERRKRGNSFETDGNPRDINDMRKLLGL